MGQINLRIPDELEEKFRGLAVKKFGPYKGFLTNAFMEALEDWVKKNTSK